MKTSSEGAGMIVRAEKPEEKGKGKFWYIKMNPKLRRFELWMYKDGKAKNLIAWFKWRISYSVNYKMMIALRGSFIKLYVNGKNIWNYEVKKEFLLSKGTFGLMGSKCIFKHFALRSYNKFLIKDQRANRCKKVRALIRDFKRSHPDM